MRHKISWGVITIAQQYDVVIKGTGMGVGDKALTDNLMKGLMDALSGIVFKDDARIAKVFGTEKIFGEVPRTEIIFYKLEE